VEARIVRARWQGFDCHVQVQTLDRDICVDLYTDFDESQGLCDRPVQIEGEGNAVLRISKVTDEQLREWRQSHGSIVVLARDDQQNIVAKYKAGLP